MLNKINNKFISGKKLIVILAFLIFQLTLDIEQCKCQWVSGLGGVGILSLTSSTNKIFAGSYASQGVWISTDNGVNWNQTSLNNRTVYSLASIDNNVFAGTETYGIYLSTNSGVNWSQTALANRSVRSILINGNNIFAGTDTYGVYLSTNNGSSWIQTSLNNKWIFSLAIKGNTLFAGAQYSGIYISTDNGTTWNNTFPGQTASAFTVLGNNIFSGYGSNGLYYSTDNGINWQQTALNSVFVQSLASVWSNIFAGTTYNGVYLSTNNGNNWQLCNEGFSSIPKINALLIYNNYIFAGVSNGPAGVFRRPLSELITNTHNYLTEISLKFHLSQNYPNPFNPVTRINYEIPKKGFVSLKVYEILGKEVKTLVSQVKSMGYYSVDFNAAELSSGVYFYKITSGDFTDTKKLTLIK